MKILMVSRTPTDDSGLGKAIRYAGLGLAARGHEVAFAGQNYDGVPHPDIPHSIYIWRESNRLGENENSLPLLRKAIDSERPDAVIFLGDAWHFRGLDNLRAELEKERRCPTFLLWLTVGEMPIAGELVPLLEAAHHLLTTTVYGAQVLGGIGPGREYTRLPLNYRATPVPLGIDPTYYGPGEPTRDEILAQARQVICTDGRTRIILGYVGRNQFRKQPGTALQVLRILHDAGVGAVLFMKTNVTGGELDLPMMAGSLGFRICVGDPRQADQPCDVYIDSRPVPEAAMRGLYCGFDVQLHPAVAAAPDLPILEARACGVPVVAVDGCSMRETATVVTPPLGIQAALPNFWLPIPDPQILAQACLDTVGQPPGETPIPTWDTTVDGLEHVLAKPRPDYLPGLVF